MIKVENVSMKFRMNNDRVQSLKEFVIAAATHRLKYKDFWVFRDVSFEVEKGAVMGIIGRNGAGKSTLLKIISGILAPTCGRVELAGRIVPMLELGSGFDYELTGRENIFLNGSILGYSEQFLKEKYNEIVEFSELGDFIETPIRNYSSGMMMRLAFSIATVVQPEILIVDEILAVGDEAFQKKSKRKMLELMGGGTTVLFVSHSLAQIREMCSRVIWLEQGRVKMEGETKYVCDKYQEYLNPAGEGRDKKPKASDAVRNLSDVLFIYGDDENAYEWRVTYQREQLLAGAVPTNEIYVQDIQEDIAKLYRVFVCVRCSNTPKMRQFLHYAKELHKKICFDFSYCSDNIQMPDPQEELFVETKEICDGVIVTSKELSGQYRQEGCRLICNPPAVDERMAEYASWAVYDRDVLPYCNMDSLSEEELVNYNRAVARKRKQAAGSGCIGFFAESWKGMEGQAAANVLTPLLQAHKGLRLMTADNGEELPGQMWPYAEQIQLVRNKNREDLLRNYAEADVVLLVNTGERQQDRLLQSWLCAAFVKVPCFYMDDGSKAHGGTEGPLPFLIEEAAVCICRERKHAQKELYHFLTERILREKTGAAAYAYARRRHSSVYTGNRMGRWIRRFMQPNFVFLVSMERIGTCGQIALHHAALMKKRGYDVTILVTGKSHKNFVYDGVLLPAVSRELVYSYQYFDVMVSCDWASTRWMQNYANVGRRIYLVTGYEPDYFKTGNAARLEAEQMYQPHVPMEFATVSEWCRRWLLKDYGQEAKRLPGGISYGRLCIGNISKFQTVRKILIVGDCGNESENLQEAFMITDQLEKQSYEICFCSYGTYELTGYSYQKAYQCQSQEEVFEMYQDCDILLETGRRISCWTAPLAMMASGGAVVVMRDEANADYLEDGKNCAMYQPGDIAGAAACIHKLSSDALFRERIIENGRQTAQSYDWKYADQEITKFYEEKQEQL